MFGELLLRVVRSLLLQQVRLQHPSLDNVVHVHELFAICQVALEEIVDPLDDLLEQRLLLLVKAPATCFCERLRFRILAVPQGQATFALILERVVGEDDLGQVDPFALPAEVQQPE